MPRWSDAEWTVHTEAEIEAGRDPFAVGAVNPEGKLICGARNRRGLPCGVRALYPNGRCHNHGGPTPGGIASSNYQHGRYSKYMPAHLLQRYEEAVNDPELLSLDHEIAVVDARVGEVMQGIGRGESGKIWSVLSKLKHDVDYGVRQRRLSAKMDDKDGEISGAKLVADSTNEIMKLIEVGSAEWAQWEEVVNLFERRRRLVDSEQKRRMNMQNLVRVEDAKILLDAMVHALHEAVGENVEDLDEQRATIVQFQLEYSKIIG